MVAEETQTAEKFRSNATLIIHVQDKNDNTPEFAGGFFQAAVMENLPGETFVFQVGAMTGRFISEFILLPLIRTRGPAIEFLIITRPIYRISILGNQCFPRNVAGIDIMFPSKEGDWRLRNVETCLNFGVNVILFIFLSFSFFLQQLLTISRYQHVTMT